MSTHSVRASLATIAFVTSALAAEPNATAPQLGIPITPDEIAKWNLTVFPDGRGLPPGRGTPVDGRAIYDKRCASCHGEAGRGATAEELVAEPQQLDTPAASKAIGPYWPYATTLFDYIRRSMPPSAPGSLTADEIYAVTAYLLAANKVIGEADVMDARSLPAVKMPNRDGFDWIDVKK